MAVGDTGLTNLVLTGDLTVGDEATIATKLTVASDGTVFLNLPTSDPGVAGPESRCGR